MDKELEEIDYQPAKETIIVDQDAVVIDKDEGLAQKEVGNQYFKV